MAEHEGQLLTPSLHGIADVMVAGIMSILRATKGLSLSNTTQTSSAAYLDHAAAAHDTLPVESLPASAGSAHGTPGSTAAQQPCM